MGDETGRKPLMGNQLGYAFQNRKLLPMSNTRGQMQALPRSIRTVQGCKKVIKHVFAFPSPAAVWQQLRRKSLRSSLTCVGCCLKVCIPSSGHTWIGCIFPCMWTERQREIWPSFPVILTMSLWNLSPQGGSSCPISLVLFTCCPHFCQGEMGATQSYSQWRQLTTALCWYGLGCKNKVRNRHGQYLVAVCPTSWKCPVLQALALLFFGGWLVLSKGSAVWESSLLQSH